MYKFNQNGKAVTVPKNQTTKAARKSWGTILCIPDLSNRLDGEMPTSCSGHFN